MTDNFYEKIGHIFTDRYLPIPEFHYIKEIKSYIAIRAFILDSDNREYDVVVKADGTVVYGDFEGNNFYEVGILGHI